LNSGIQAERIFFVGNVMIDTLNANLAKAIQPAFWSTAGLEENGYFVLTLHRPSNVDNADSFARLVKTINGFANAPIVFPVHPRTRKNLDQVRNELANIIPTDPMSYLEFIFLLKNSKGVVTDSGGIQEESTVLGIPCITLRNNTERPETITLGTNELLGDDMHLLQLALERVQNGQWKAGSIPPLWDGRAADRIVEILETLPIDTTTSNTPI
jgi:UDP-N-acetylglucosamine 2-epimerase (non-hydrolysing)